MPDSAPSIRDYEISVARDGTSFEARIPALGIAASGATAEAAVAEVARRGEDYLSAIKQVGLDRDIPRPGATASETARPRGPSFTSASGTTNVVATPASDSYLRFFVKTLIAAAVFVIAFGAAAFVGAYVFGNTLVNVAANAIQARTSRLTAFDLDVVSTGFVDTTTRIATYIQRVPAERKLELAKNLHFIASEMAPYLRDVMAPISDASGTASPPATTPAASAPH